MKPATAGVERMTPDQRSARSISTIRRPGLLAL
jgi:hypothetical protein